MSESDTATSDADLSPADQELQAQLDKLTDTTPDGSDDSSQTAPATPSNDASPDSSTTEEKVGDAEEKPAASEGTQPVVPTPQAIMAKLQLEANGQEQTWTTAELRQRQSMADTAAARKNAREAAEKREQELQGTRTQIIDDVIPYMLEDPEGASDDMKKLARLKAEELIGPRLDVIKDAVESPYMAKMRDTLVGLWGDSSVTRDQIASLDLDERFDAIARTQYDMGRRAAGGAANDAIILTNNVREKLGLDASKPYTETDVTGAIDLLVETAVKANGRKVAPGGGRTSGSEDAISFSQLNKKSAAEIKALSDSEFDAVLEKAVSGG